MSTHTRIVCALADQQSGPALKRTYEIARQRDWSVDAVHAVNLPGGLFGLMEADALTRARAGVLDQLAPVMKAYGGAEALERDLRIDPGSPRKVLTEASQEAARIVLGAHSRDGLTDLFRNTTRTVVTQAPCPVWLERGSAQPIRRILAAVDLAPEGRQTVAMAREEAEAFGAELELVHVFDLTVVGTVFGYEVPLPASAQQASRVTAQREFDKLLDSFDWTGKWAKRTTRHFIDGDPGRELLDRATEADLLVFGTHGRGRFANAVIGSVASELIRSSPAPMLTFKLVTES